MNLLIDFIEQGDDKSQDERFVDALNLVEEYEMEAMLGWTMRQLFSIDTSDCPIKNIHLALELNSKNKEILVAVIETALLGLPDLPVNPLPKKFGGRKIA